MQLPFRHPLDPREERQVLPGRQRPDERVELWTVADQPPDLTGQGPRGRSAGFG